MDDGVLVITKKASKDITLKDQILDIEMNLSRIGNWAADGYEERKEKIRPSLLGGKDDDLGKHPYPPLKSSLI